MFCRPERPVTLKTDNGSQFTSLEFHKFCEENGIEHLRTTPKWAQANGEVEWQNRSLEKRLSIAQAQHQDWRAELRKYLRQYRSIPHTPTGRSPAELLFRRKLRGKIPETDVVLQELREDIDMCDQDTRDRDAEIKAETKIYTDAKLLAKPSEITISDHILVQ